MLSERFDNLLIRIGNPTLEHPVFYKCPVAIRFEIGGETPVYSDASLLRDTVVNSQYIGASLQRAKAIYSSLPQPPNLLRIDTHPNEDGPGYGNGLDLSVLQNLVSLPHEQREQQINDGDEQYMVLQLYWDLCKIDFSPELLLREIIKADLGHTADFCIKIPLRIPWNLTRSLVSSVYFANTEEVYLYHIYDDRGADLVAERKETLWPIYHNFNQWILDCDRKEIDKLFAT